MDEKERKEELVEHVKNLSTLIQEYVESEKRLIETLRESAENIQKCLDKIYGIN